MPSPVQGIAGLGSLLGCKLRIAIGPSVTGSREQERLKICERKQGANAAGSSSVKMHYS